MDTSPLHVLDEIDQRIADMRAQADAAGVTVLAPLLALGTSERVGSNWLSDTLRPVMPQHNEPFRQQLGAMHPLSPINPHSVDLDQVPNSLLGALGRHSLVEFVVAKYAPIRHVLKETNLFFTAESLLRLFADAPVAVLTRSPLGIASSFARSDLYRRWRYADRYRQMITMTSVGPRTRFAALVPDDDAEPLNKLVRMVVLNTVLLAEAVDDRGHIQIRYEASVLDRVAGWTALAELVPSHYLPCTPQSASATADDLFATTNHKISLTTQLTSTEAAQVIACTAATLAAAATQIAPSALDRAATWLTGAEHYQLAEPTPPQQPQRSRVTSPPVPKVAYVQLRGVAWRNLLVSNAEFCALLNTLHTAWVTNTRDGTHLLLVPMPYERGGRIHWSSPLDAWTVSPGYEHHPVYWVTWLGAALFAAVSTARLPTHDDLGLLAADAQPSNHDYALGDVTPIAQAITQHGIHHPVGNLQVWCADGPPTRFGEPVERWIHGAAWNTPAGIEEIGRLRSRHLLGASRGIGIRLVRDENPQFTGLTIAQGATVLNSWTDSLADRTRLLTDMDLGLVRALQTDVALQAHV